MTEAYHGPALQSLERSGHCRVTALFDPSPARVEAIKALFPAAASIGSMQDLQNLEPGLALVASPAKYHAAQTIAALEAGWAVFCEKPMAANLDEAEEMIAASRRTQRPLCIGLYRRHLPAVKAVHQVLNSGVLGKPVRFEIAEGGPFGWPAASAQFFQKQHVHGGVLHDAGVHVLDLCALWFGDPTSVDYEDDAMGNLEINCRVRMQYPGGLTGEVRLSRDWKTMNRTFIQCEQGWIAWRPGEAQKFEMALDGNGQVFQVDLAQTDQQWALPTAGIPVLTFQQCLTRQIENALAAAQGKEAPEVSGEEALRSLKVIDYCYQNRRLMAMPWLSAPERRRAEELAA